MTAPDSERVTRAATSGSASTAAFTPTPERYYAPVTSALVAGARIAPGMRTLDLHSTSGYPALTIAGLVGPPGSVCATHPSEERLDSVRRTAEELGLGNLELVCVESEALAMPASSFDAVTVRHAMVFMREPTLALGQAHGVLRTGGRIALSEWAELRGSPFVHVALDVLTRLQGGPPPAAPRGFLFSEEGRLQAMLEGSGFGEIVVQPLEFVFAEYDSGDDYWSYARRFSVPLSRAYEALSEADRALADVAIAAEAERYRVGDKVVFRSRAWIASGVKT